MICHLSAKTRHSLVERRTKAPPAALPIRTCNRANKGNNMKKIKFIRRTTIAVAVCLLALNPVMGSELGPVVDDFSNPDRSALGFERYFVDDTTAGGQTRADFSPQQW